MLFWFIIFIIIPLIVILYLLFRYRDLVLKAYKVSQAQKQAKREQAEERARQERVKRNTNPDQSSVEVLRDALIDYEGGEYVEYEEVEKEP